MSTRVSAHPRRHGTYMERTWNVHGLAEESDEGRLADCTRMHSNIFMNML